MCCYTFSSMAEEQKEPVHVLQVRKKRTLSSCRKPKSIESTITKQPLGTNMCNDHLVEVLSFELKAITKKAVHFKYEKMSFVGT